MASVNRIRLAVSTVAGLALAAGLAVQSAGIALTRKAPATAVSLFPRNGLADENLAASAFLSASEGLVPGEVGMATARRWAVSAYELEPLVPDAHAILALAQSEAEVRSKIVRFASQLDRRSSKLQAVVLQEQVNAQDYPGAVATLDRILRVQPSRAPELFPTLLPVFVREGAVDEFARILDGTSPWHQDFYRYAAMQPIALPNLLELRRRVSFEDRELDQLLLKNLAAAGELELAYGFYQDLDSGDAAELAMGKLDWDAKFAPFEWVFSDRVGLRAQPSLNEEGIEISVRPGKGGVVARRLIKTPTTPFVLEVIHNMQSSNALEDIDIGLRCAGADKAVLLDRSLGSQGDGYDIAKQPASCTFLELTIKARAWSGRSALKGRLDSIRMYP